MLHLTKGSAPIVAAIPLLQNGGDRFEEKAEIGSAVCKLCNEPTLITFGRHDQVTSTRFAHRLKSGIRNSELVILEGCAHAPLYERVEEFNERTLAFLQRRAGAAVA